MNVKYRWECALCPKLQYQKRMGRKSLIKRFILDKYVTAYETNRFVGNEFRMPNPMRLLEKVNGAEKANG